MAYGAYNKQIRTRGLKAPISASSSGDTVVVSGVTGKRIRVLSYVIVAHAAVVATWKTTSGAISGPLSFADHGGASAIYNPEGHVDTAIGESLILNLASAVSVGGHLTYELVDPGW